jgi:hypothetical protein
LQIITDCSCPILQLKEKVQDITAKGGGWGSERHYICIIAGETEKKHTAMKVFPLVLLVKVGGK